MKMVFEFVAYVLMICGLLAIVTELIRLFTQNINIGQTKAKLVLIVKNQEDAIEGIVRNIFLSNCLKGISNKCGLTIVDMGSSDDTLKILSKLKSRYKNLEILEADKKDEIFAEYSYDEGKVPVGNGSPTPT